VFGAGALGLGFLGPELSRDCHVTFVDVPAKRPFVEQLSHEGAYTFNQSGLTMRAVRVETVTGLLTEGQISGSAVPEALDRADLVFTAVGGARLPGLAPVLGRAAVRRTADVPLRVLCAENGVEVARGLRAHIRQRLGDEPAGRLLTGDTVMGRMCKVVAGPEPPLEPVAPGQDWAVVSEQFYGIPVQQHVVAGLSAVPEALQPLPPAAFHVAEDIKMLAHNGLHAILACLGRLRGRRFFSELRSDAQLMELARRLLAEEVGPALARKHGRAFDRNRYMNYCDSILRRTTCPVFHDPISRGVRGIMRKLEPWERLVYGVRTVAEQGIEPGLYATGLAAAVLLARASGETDLGFREVLTGPCGFDPAKDAGLISLIESRRRAATP